MPLSSWPTGHYRTVYLDPPWPEQGGGKIKRGADRHYELMSVKQIAAMPIPQLLDPAGAHVYCWATNNYLPDALDIIRRDWGLTYITTITWGKDKMGLGQYYRGKSEHLIFARTKRILPYRFLPNGKRAQGKTLYDFVRTQHSRKPEEFYAEIEKVSHGPYPELFARPPHRTGWAVWGNEAA